MQYKGKITSSGNNWNSVDAKIELKSSPHTTYHGFLDYWTTHIVQKDRRTREKVTNRYSMASIQELWIIMALEALKRAKNQQHKQEIVICYIQGFMKSQ